jgi:hypothetical protein
MTLKVPERARTILPEKCLRITNTRKICWASNAYVIYNWKICWTEHLACLAFSFIDVVIIN